jgi:outer membrane protein assembly factor BamA
MKKLFCCLYLILCHALDVFAQNVQMVMYETYARDSVQITKTQQKSIVEGYNQLKKIIQQKREQGFLAAAFDSIKSTDQALHAWMYVGPQYSWAHLSFSQIPHALLNDMQIREHNWSNQLINPTRFAALTDKMLQYCENNGYPFATTYLDSIASDSANALHARLILDRGKLVKMDSILIEGTVEVSRDFLLTYLDIHQGDLYNEAQLKLISKKIKELSFVQESQPWQIEFGLTKTQLKIFLKEKKSNQLNGLIGLQPNTIETGKFLLTADILIALKNALSYGESISLSYQQLQYKSPRFHTEVLWPYILGTPLGAEGSFDLFKKDSAFRRTSLEMGIRYQFNASDYLRIFYQNQSNRIITPDTNFVRNNKSLPDNLDISTSGAGVEFVAARTDYNLNPRKGWMGSLAASGFIRNIQKNDAITGINDGTGFNYSSLYDTVNNNKYQYRVKGNVQYYLPLMKNLVLRVAYNGGYISGSRLFMNELYQIGGFKLLRGFDEQSIYVNQYHIASIDLRFLLSQNSYFYIFNDDAMIHTRFASFDKKDYPVSIGLGMTLESGSGIFNIAIATGKRSGEQFQLRSAKIHFGYVAYF